MDTGVETRFWAKVDKSGECWIWQAAKIPRGYGVMTVDGRPRYAHRLSYEIARGPIPDGLYVCHTCDVRDCVRPDHLFLGTNADNMADMNAKGRHAKAYSRKPNTSDIGMKLTRKQVETIRARYAAGARYRDLAQEYGVSHTAIWLIITDQTWKCGKVTMRDGGAGDKLSRIQELISRANTDSAGLLAEIRAIVEE